MNYKKGISLMLIYFFILAITPLNLSANNVEAIESINQEEYTYKKYDTSNTWIHNKYGIIGNVINIKQYKDGTAVLTESGLYFIKNGQATAYEMKDVAYNSYISKDNSDLYFTPYLLQKDHYGVIKIDLEKKETENIGLDKYYDDYNAQLIEGSIDSNKDSWFSVLQYDRHKSFGEENFKVYNLLRISGDKEEIYSTIENPPNIQFKDVFTGMKVDSNNNLWFKIQEYDVHNETNSYKLGKVISKDNIVYFNFQNEIKDYTITDEGHIWALIRDDKLLHLNSKGEKINQYNIENVQSVTKDQNGHIWILQNGEIKRFEGEEFITKYTVDNKYNKLSVYDENNIATSGVKGFTIIENENRENIIVDNYINDSAYIMNNDGNIVVLSADYDNWNVKKNNRDEALTITDIKSNGVLTLESIAEGKYLPYFQAQINKEDIYIPSLNTLYKISRLNEVDFTKLYAADLQEEYNDYLKSIEFDSENRTYVINDRQLFILNKGKVVKETSIEEITKRSSFIGYGVFQKLIKDRDGAIYVIVNMGQYSIPYRIDSPDDIHEALEYKNNSEYPVNIFLDHAKELRAVYNTEEGYKIYKYNGISLQEDERFKGEGIAISNGFNTISEMERAEDGTLFVLMYRNILFIKGPNSKEFHEAYKETNYALVNSLVKDDKGGVYMGTLDKGIIHYGASQDIEENNNLDIQSSLELELIK